MFIITQFVAVITLAGWAYKMQRSTSIIVFLGHSALTGLTLSTIFFVYVVPSITKTFVATAGIYGSMAFYGYTTKKDLSVWGSFLFMLLIGVVIGSVMNIWMQSNYLDFMVTYGGIVVFAGLTAWGHQKLKSYALADLSGTNNMAIRGSLMLYLDFINLFLLLLRVINRRRF